MFYLGKKPGRKMENRSLPNQNQSNLFAPLLKEMLDPRHELYNLANRIDWESIEVEFKPLYSKQGRPAHPIRLMVSLLILKQLYNLGDETLPSAWVQNPYFQYFSGFDVFQWKFPIATSDLVHFRKRIGKQGAEFILKSSIDIQDQRKVTCKEVSIDTTVQPKNITYPTDGKLRKKVIDKCVALAKENGIQLRRTYQKELKTLKLQMYNGQHPKRRKNARKALKRLNTIANKLIRELSKKMTAADLALNQELLDLWKKAANQQRNDKNKIYSLHETDVACIAKGKVHPKYEFGSKVSLIVTQNTNLILGVTNFKGNPHDSKTVAESLETMKRVTGKQPIRAFADRGYRGKKNVLDTQIIIPTNGRGLEEKERKKAKRKMRRRTAIEPIISHTKHQFKMAKNYLKGVVGDEINAILAGAAFNFKSWMNQLLNFWLRFLSNQYRVVQKLLFCNPLRGVNMSF